MSTRARTTQGAGLLYATVATVLAGALLLVVAPLHGQETDARWMPFVGCWESLGAEEDGGLLCFTPFDGGVELAQWVNGEVASTETLASDGVRRPVAMEGCEGWESVEFSGDGRRVFTTTEFVCGDESPRTGTGVMTFVTPTMWADVRALDVDGEKVAWVQEYRLVGVDRLGEEGVDDPAVGRGMAVRSGRISASAPIDLDDVLEATERMDEKAVETWVAVQGDELDPSADELIMLADAGVSDAVIDAVVAVSHPDRFVVEAGGAIDEAEVERPRYRPFRGYMAFSPYWGPRWGLRYGYDPFYYGYDPYYGYGYGSYGYGYPYGGYYGYGTYGSRGGWVIIDRRRGDSGGRVYNGRGYSRGAGGEGGRTAVPRGSGDPGSVGGADRGSAGSSRPAAPTRRAVPRRRPGGSGSSALSSVGSTVRRLARPSSNRSVRPRAPVRNSRPAASRGSSSRPSVSSRPARSGSGASRPARRRPGG